MDESIDLDETPPADHSYFRFSLRTALLLFIGFAIAIYAWAGPATRQKQAVNMLRDLDFNVSYSSRPEWVPDWLFNQLGIDYFCRLEKVNSVPVSSLDQFPHVRLLTVKQRSPPSRFLKLFPDLRTIELHSDVDLRFLKNIQNLECIHDKSGQTNPFPSLNGVRSLTISKNAGTFDCAKLDRFQNLESLFLHSRFSNLKYLETLPKLKTLAIGSFSIRGRLELDLADIQKLEGLEELFVFGYQVHDFSPLCGLENLEKLLIKPQADLELGSLYEMNGLQQLVVSPDALGETETDKLRKQLPGCEIIVTR